MTRKSIMKRALNRSFYYGFSSILGRIVGFIMLPIYTNYLTPADYGVAGFLMFYVYLTQTLIGGRLELAISKFHYDKSIELPLGVIVNTAAAFTVLVSFIPITIAMIYSSELSQIMFHTVKYRYEVMIVSLNILFITTETYGLRYLNIVDRPKIYLLLNIIKLVFQLVINIWLIVFLQVGIIGVVISLASASVLITIITFAIIFFEQSELNIRFDMFKKFFKFSAPLWGAALLGLYSGSIHNVFITRLSSLNDLGLYSLGGTFGSLVVALAWGPFFTYWSNERFRIHDKEDAKEIFRKVFYISTGITLFLGFGIAVFADPIIKIMANKDFHAASLVVAPICAVQVLTYLGWFLNFSFHITDNNKQIAKNGIVYAVLITILYSVLIPLWGYVGAAYGLLLANLIMIHVIEWKTRKFYDIGVNILKVDFMVFIMFMLYYSFNYVNEVSNNPWQAVLILFVLIFASLSLLLLLAYLKYPLNVKEISNQIRQLFGNKNTI